MSQRKGQTKGARKEEKRCLKRDALVQIRCPAFVFPFVEVSLFHAVLFRGCDRPPSLSSGDTLGMPIYHHSRWKGNGIYELTRYSGA